MTPTEKPPIGQESVDAQLLAKRLATVSSGERVTYDELSALIRRPVNGSARGILYTALRIAQRENGIVFGTVQAVGIVRLTDQEIANLHRPALSRIGRISKRTAKKMAQVKNWDALSDAEKRAYSAGLGALGAVSLFSSSKSQKQLEEKCDVPTAPAKPDVQKLVALFSK